ncbi:hypothetical protein MMC30_001453 [Trapelia coarctata]|nr:hypothetical protein [Trapelia coarctata]
MFFSTALIYLVSYVAALPNPCAEAAPGPIGDVAPTSAIILSSSSTSLTIPTTSSVSTASSTPTSIVPTSRTYVLKTNSSNPTFSNLYLESYHTGAGLGDAVLVPAAPGSRFSNGFLNGTYQEFDFGNIFPWGMYMTSPTYGSWFPVQINVGYGSPGFYFNNTDGTGKVGLKWVDGWPYQLAGDKFNEWNGWLGEFFSILFTFGSSAPVNDEMTEACNWTYGVPQLFWLAIEVPAFHASVPCNCAEVELVREFTD